MSGKRRRMGNGNGKTSRKDVIMLDYDTWMKVKTECENEAQVIFQRMSEPAQAAMKEAHEAGAIIEIVSINGDWVAASIPIWHKGLPHRVSPSWPGPAKPEPVVEYEDKNVFMVGASYRFSHPSEDGRWLLASAPAMVGFCGYIYEDAGKEWCHLYVQSDIQPDGTLRMRIPKAVRFLKGAVA